MRQSIKCRPSSSGRARASTISSSFPPRAANSVWMYRFVDKFRRELRETGKSQATTISRTAGLSPSSRPRLRMAAGSASMRTSRSSARRPSCRGEGRRTRTANARFNAALRHMSQGICLYNPDQRVVVANSRYAEIYRLREDQVKPGTTCGKFCRRACENGTNFAIDSGRLRHGQRQAGDRDPGARRRARGLDQAAADGQWRLADHA